MEFSKVLICKPHTGRLHQLYYPYELPIWDRGKNRDVFVFPDLLERVETLLESWSIISDSPYAKDRLAVRTKMTADQVIALLIQNGILAKDVEIVRE